MNTNIVPYESNHRGNAHQLSKIPETTDCLSRPSLVELLSHGEQNVPNEIYFATISPAEEVRDDQTNPSLIGRAFSRNSQLRCSVVLIVDGIMFLLLMISIIVLGLPTGSYLFRPRYAASVICAGAGLGMVLIATGCVGICAALTRKTVHAEICAALSLISSGSLFISFIIVVTMFHRLTDKHWAGSGVDFAVLTVSIIIFIVGITTGIIQTMVQFRILMCFSKKKVDVTTGDIDHTTAPVLLISDDEMQLAITQKGEGNKD